MQQHSITLAKDTSCPLKKHMVNLLFMSTLDLISQFSVSILGATAIVLVAKKNKWGGCPGRSLTTLLVYYFVH